jgi:CheY-like chemotaxis protein
MDGLTLCRTLQRLNPATPIIFSSGAVLGDRADEIATTLEELGIKHLLNKPYDSKALLHMLHEVLHEKPATKTAEPNA